MLAKSSQLIVCLAFLSLAACNGSSDSKKSPAVVPLAPERVNALDRFGAVDQSNYCDISTPSAGNKTVVCYSPQGNQYGQPINQPNAALCAGVTISYADANMCSALQQVLQSNSQRCGQFALQYLYQQKCANVNSVQPGPTPGLTPGPSQPLDSNFKAIQCEFEAARTVQYRFFGRTYEEVKNTGHLTTMVTIDSRIRQSVDLRGLFLGIDLGSFGTTKMTFSPATLSGGAESITISNSGLNGNTAASQSGFAGEEVRLETQNDDGTLRLMVSCKGTSIFKKPIVKSFSKLTCKGSSNLGSRKEIINVSLPYGGNLLQNEITLAENLVMTVTGDTANKDNARITLMATGVDTDLTVKTSAYLKTSAQLKVDDGYSSVDVTCIPVQ